MLRIGLVCLGALMFSLRMTFRINHAEDRVGLLGDTDVTD